MKFKEAINVWNVAKKMALFIADKHIDCHGFNMIYAGGGLSEGFSVVFRFEDKPLNDSLFTDLFYLFVLEKPHKIPLDDLKISVTHSGDNDYSELSVNFKMLNMEDD